jgi:transposase
LDVSIATIRTALLQLKLTIKRRGLDVDRVNDPTRIELRRNFAVDFLLNGELNDVNNIFVDESGFNLHIRRNYGRSTRGSRVSVVVPTVRGRNTTLICAINKNGVLHSKIICGSCTGELFSTFIKELDEKLISLYGIRNGTIYMDNCSIHRSYNVSSTINSLINNTKFLSPYSYMLNPIENCFGKIKTFVRNNFGVYGSDLGEMIERAISQVTSNDCEGWFRLIRRNCSLAMQGQYFY